MPSNCALLEVRLSLISLHLADSAKACISARTSPGRSPIRRQKSRDSITKKMRKQKISLRRVLFERSYHKLKSCMKNQRNIRRDEELKARLELLNRNPAIDSPQVSKNSSKTQECSIKSDNSTEARIHHPYVTHFKNGQRRTLC